MIRCLHQSRCCVPQSDLALASRATLLTCILLMDVFMKGYFTSSIWAVDKECFFLTKFHRILDYLYKCGMSTCWSLWAGSWEELRPHRFLASLSISSYLLQWLSAGFHLQLSCSKPLVFRLTTTSSLIRHPSTSPSQQSSCLR